MMSSTNLITVEGGIMETPKSRQEQSRIKKRKWQAHLHAWKKSGLSQVEYCRQHDLSSSKFCYWKRKLNRSEESAVSFVSVPVCAQPEVSSQQPINDSGLTILLKSGIRIGVDNNFSSRTLADVVAVLGGGS